MLVHLFVSPAPRHKTALDQAEATTCQYCYSLLRSTCYYSQDQLFNSSSMSNFCCGEQCDQQSTWLLFANLGYIFTLYDLVQCMRQIEKGGIGNGIIARIG